MASPDRQPTDPASGTDAPTVGDTPVIDRLWASGGTGLIGLLAVSGTAVAVASMLGRPPRAAAALTGLQLAWLSGLALGGSALVGRGGWRLCRYFAGAVALAFAAGIPAAAAVLMAAEWLDAREPLATWSHLVATSIQLAALEAMPVGYLLWRLQAARSPRGISSAA